MPRNADIPGQPARHRAQVLLTDQDMEALDDLRDTMPLSTYLRDIIRTHIRRTRPNTADHTHHHDTWVASRTVAGVTVNTYQCLHCTHTKEVVA